MQNTGCEKHNELLANAASILEKLHGVTANQRSVIVDDGVCGRFFVLDKELELLMGEKERAIGALRQHDEEHKCQNK